MSRGTQIRTGVTPLSFEELEKEKSFGVQAEWKGAGRRGTVE